MPINWLMQQVINHPDAGQPEHTFIWVPIVFGDRRKIAFELSEPNTKVASATSLLVNKLSVDDYIGLDPGTFAISIIAKAYGEDDQRRDILIVYPMCRFNREPTFSDQIEILASKTSIGIQGEPLQDVPNGGSYCYIEWLAQEA